MQKRRCRARLLLGPGTINNNLYVFPRPSRLQRSSAGDHWQNTVIMYSIVYLEFLGFSIINIQMKYSIPWIFITPVLDNNDSSD